MPNRLSLEKSPYLLQHASNPVDWMPWGEEAFARAQAEDKLVLVSIGYSTCHWCHVMEHESFSDAAVAALMNRLLVCIKVDREERPDVDRVYMNAVMALTGQGGWPLNCFLTPEGKPFYGGTYFPPRPAFQRPSWAQLVEAVGLAWKDPAQRQRVVQDAASLTQALQQREAPGEAATTLTPAPLEAVFRDLQRSFDAQQGGFSDAPKFPMPGYQRLLFRLSDRFRSEGRAEEAAEAQHMALETLRLMARGGIHDLLGGGFARYSTDERWHVPHFEKMLYDNAQLALNYLEGWQASGDRALEATLRGIIGYVLRDLRAPEGGFYSAEDADSLVVEGGLKKEGAFYAWDKAEVEAVLGPELSAAFCACYGVERDGNVSSDPHHEFPGLNVLYDRRGTLAAETGGNANLAPAELERRLALARQKLFEAREQRPRPQRDEKVLAAWNGLMIAALAKSGAALGEAAWVEAAEAAGRFFLERMWQPAEGLLWRRFAGGERGIEGQAEDYAFLAWGYLELHQATAAPAWLEAAQALMRAARTRFFDTRDGLYLSGGLQGDPRLPVKVKDSQDNVEPAASSVMADLQLRLWDLSGEAAWRDDAERTLKGCFAALERAPRSRVHLAGALDRWLRGGVHVVVCGARDHAGTVALLAAARAGLSPRLDLLWAEPGQPLLGVPEGYALKDGRPAAYLCHGGTCLPGVSTPAELTALLQKA